MVRRPQSYKLALGGVVGVFLLAFAMVPAASAGWNWPWKKHCGHAGCGPGQCVQSAEWAGEWHWVRSPDQQPRVVMSLYNRYCVRCHGVDGRGVCDIPDVPNFTEPRWQTSRPDPQIARIVIEGRGACMPAFRGTLTIEETCAIFVRYVYIT